MRIESLCTVAVLTIALSASAAKADIFDFSFTNDPAMGFVPGTVTGEIIGLVNNSTGPATEVLITSFPGVNTHGPLPINATDWGQQLQNSFTEVNGQIVSGSFWAITNGLDGEGDLIIDGDGSNNFVILNGGANCCNYLWANNGIAADNFTLVPSTPEPGYVVLVALGLGGLVFLKLRRNAVRD